ncbi:unnamed protein product [Ambrosiozyma monospora]|uniref:Unnamed protein product n=1 Tax=Ambrosiozyma monospora TaxID=43982 RepID=A0A9W7DG70_AMBMO|nr:unnamed protein product [Ambrosiozyma monospora]
MASIVVQGKQKFFLLIGASFILLFLVYVITNNEESRQLTLKPIKHFLTSKYASANGEDPVETAEPISSDNTRSEDAKIVVIDADSLVQTEHVSDDVKKAEKFKEKTTD